MKIPGVDLSQLRVVDGGEQVRLGRARDGGYVLPERVVGTCSALVSLGISTEWSFEADFARRNRTAPILGFDHSISAKKFRRSAMRGAVAAARFGLLGRHSDD
jgi:hypothetical protein